jgi:hypothetical protein
MSVCNARLMAEYKYPASRALRVDIQHRSKPIIMSPIEEETISSCASDYGSDAGDGLSGETTYQDPARILGENLSIMGATFGYIQDNFFDHSSPPAYGIAKDLFGRWTRKHLKDIKQLLQCTSSSDNGLSALCEPLHRCSPERFARFKPKMPEAKLPNERLLLLFKAAEEARQRAMNAYRDLVTFSNYPLCQILSFGLHNIQHPHAAHDQFFVSNFEDLSIVGHYISNAMLKSEEGLTARYTQILDTIRGTEVSLKEKKIEREVVNLQLLYWNPSSISYQLLEEQLWNEINKLKFEQLQILRQYVSHGCDDNFETMNSIFELHFVHPRMNTQA